MAAPKTETILRYCSPGTAIEVLDRAGLLAPHEKADLFARERARNDVWAARIYKNGRRFKHPFIEGALDWMDYEAMGEEEPSALAVALGDAGAVTCS